MKFANEKRCPGFSLYLLLGNDDCMIKAFMKVPQVSENMKK